MLINTRTRLTSAPSLFIAVGFAVLAIMSVISVTLELKSREDVARVSHTLEVKNALADLMNEVRRAEITYRGYLLTSETVYRDLYHTAAQRLKPLVNRLTQLTSDNPDQQRTLDELCTLIEQKVRDIGAIIALFNSGATDGALARFRDNDVRDQFPQIRTVAERMDAVESGLLVQRQTESNQTNIMLVTIELAGGALLAALAIACILVVRRSNRSRDQALQALTATNANLETAVSERTAKLQAVHEESQRLAGILSQTIASLPDGILVTDENRNILISNPAAHRLFGDEYRIGSAEWSVAYPRFRPDGVTLAVRDKTALGLAVSGHNVDNFEMILRPPGRKDINLVCNGRPIRDASGAIKGAVVIYRDVTEEKKTERQLRQSQKMEAIGQLTGGIAHDFNNILTVITGTIEILAEAVKDRPQFMAVANLINDAAERGAELTQRLLAFARKQPLQPRETDIDAFIVDAAKLLRPTLGDNFDIKVILGCENALALVDPSQLTTALLNLAINARDAMPGGGKLILESRDVTLDDSYAEANTEVTPGHYVMIAVSDSGTGIPQAIRDKVFEPFFTTKEIGKGTGLGLSMVYGFVKQSGGHIKIYSEEGHGTTIKLYLPQPAKASGTVAMDTAVPVPKGGGETILVVEDDGLVLNYVSVQLRSLGYAVLPAGSATEALALVDRGEHFDLLFTDVIMPGSMNGRLLADEVARRRPGTKVLFTSGYTENAILHHGRLDPGVLLLVKPYRKTDLARILRTALEREAAEEFMPPAAMQHR